MSAYAKFHTAFTDADLLCAALEALNLNPERQTQGIKNNWGENATVDIRIAKRHLPREVSYAGDIGFKQQKDGTFGLVASDLYGPAQEKFMNGVKQEYKIAERMKAARQAGLVFQGRKVLQTETGPRVQLSFVKR